MRHSNHNRKLGRLRKQRKALLNSLARSFLLRGKLQTTEAKAKELRPFVEKLITKSKKDHVSSRRTLSSKVGKEATKKTFSEISSKYKERAGGYTRITKLGERKSDGSPMALIELVK